MNAKYLLLLLGVYLVFSFAAITCDTGTQTNNSIALRTLTWTEGAFELAITQTVGLFKTGDPFTMRYMGKDIIGTIEVYEKIGRWTMPIYGGTPITFRPPDTSAMPTMEGIIDEDNNIYWDWTVEFPEGDQPIKGVVPPDGVLVNFKLPESRGTNEVSGKEFMLGINSRWTFNDDTYVYEYLWGEESKSGGDVVYETGNYSWDSNSKTLVLLPVKASMSAELENLITKEEALEEIYSVLIEYGFNDALVYEETNGKYNTLDKYAIAYTNQKYGLQVFSYKINGEIISELTRDLVTTLYHNIDAMEIGGCAYTQTEPSNESGNRHYLLSIDYDVAKTILESQLGSDYSACLNQDNSILTNGDNGTILEDCVIFNSYRLIRLGRENNEGIEWSRLNLDQN